MNKILLLTVLLQFGCSSNIGSDVASGFNALTPVDRPDKNDFNDIVEEIVDEMLANNQFVGRQNPIAVASIVNLTDLASTNNFGYQLSEGIVHYLHENGFRVVDFKLTGNLMVAKNGDFATSRDWEKLKGQYAIDYFVTGTMDYFAGGVNLTIRMTGAQSKIVVASSQAFVPHEMMAAFYPPKLKKKSSGSSKKINKVVSKTVKTEPDNKRRVQLVDGQLIRRNVE